MTTTGPLPAIRDPQAGDERLALLDRMGARQGDRFSRYHYPTADAIIDPGRGVLFIAVDPDPDPADWAAVCGLIRAVGFTDGGLPHRKDPGEPGQDELSGVYTWRLEYVDPCVFCESPGTRTPCPVCGRVLA